MKRSEISIQTIIFTVLAIIVLFFTILPTINTLKINKNTYENYQEQTEDTSDSSICINILSLNRNKCITQEEYTNYIQSNWVKKAGNFKDCIGKVCIECPTGKTCKD